MLTLCGSFVGNQGNQMNRIVAALVIALATTATMAQDELKFPSLGERILETQFPKFDKNNVTLTSLRKYREELEYFRDEILEGYNRAIKEYVAALGEFDRKLELARRTGKISKEQYERMHARVADEYKNASGDGDLLRSYFTYLSKYKSEARFVINEIKNREKELIKF